MVVGFVMFSGVPVPIAPPLPQPPLYQVKVPPEPPLALRLSVPPALEQKLLASLIAEVGAVRRAFTVTVVLAQVEAGPQTAVSHLAK